MLEGLRWIDLNADGEGEERDEVHQGGADHSASANSKGRVRPRARLLAVTFAILVAASGVGGCGGDQDSTSNARQVVADAAAHCKTLAFDGSYDRVRLGNSDASCEEAVAVVYVLAGGVEGPQEVESGSGPPWSCLELSPEQLPITVRCHRGSRSFSVERIRRR